MAPKRRNTGSAVERVADKFGGMSDLARGLGLDISAVYKWNYKGGNIPAGYHAGIIALAKRRRVKLRPAELVNI